VEGLNDISNDSMIVEESAPIVERIQAQVKEWGLALPRIEPLPLDFGLGKFDEIGETEFWIANEVEAGYCGKFMFLFARQTCPKHYHKIKLETFFIVKGKVRMEYKGQEMIMNPGDVLLIEIGEYHRFSGLENSLILEVSMPSLPDDSHFENCAIPTGNNYRPRYGS